MNNISKHEVEYLLTPTAIRETTFKIFELAKNGETHFNIHEDKLDSCADFVMDVIKDNYPSLDIPFHSRWGHFKVGGIDRESELNSLIDSRHPMEIVRTKLDLVITSVLLDAGAGKDWSFKENDKTFNRSEGLAVASYHLFKEGILSHDQTMIADARGLQGFTSEKLIKSFQVTPSNPLVGVDGRTQLLQKLGEVVASNSEVFPKARPGSIVDYLCNKHGKTFEVKDILDAVLKGLGPIWPGRIDADGVNLGDVWHYAPLGSEVNKDTVVCFHKLSQWLTYSLVVPMIEGGLIIEGAEKLTGLAEYRNGGLFVDFGVLELKNKENFKISHRPSSELVIEWRALTLVFLDRIGSLIQNKLGKSPKDFPLAKVLEGGTWWAGRRLANEKRSGGNPPINLDSDGTVF